MPIATPDRDRPSRRRKKKTPPPRPNNVFTRPTFPRKDPIQQRVDQARKRTSRARSKLPPLVTATPPTLKHPTRRQTEVAKDLIRAATNRNVTGSGGARVKQRLEVEQELRSDPRYRAALRAAQAYGHVDRDRQALELAKSYGVRGSRAQKVRAGHLLAISRATQAKAGPKRKFGHGALATVIQPFATGQGGDLASLLGKGFSRTASDAINLPKNAVIGGYQVGAAGVEALQGNTARGERILRGLDDGALGQLVQGNLKESAHQFGEHPLYSLLEFTGLGQASGRTLGAGMRSGLLGKAAKGRAATKRAPLEIAPGQHVERSYSKNQLVKELQLAAERQARRENRDPNVAEGDVKSGLSPRGRRMNSAVDEFVAQSEGMRRRGRGEMARDAAKIAPTRRGNKQGGRVARTVAAADRAANRAPDAAGVGRVARRRVERDVVLAAAEGRLRGPATFLEDLQHERKRLQDVYRAERKTMTVETRRANREQVKALDRVINDPKALANAPEVFRAAADFKKHAGRLEGDLVKELDITPDQALAAKLRPYAVARMGARYDKTERAPEAMVARHEQARKVETAAKDELTRASEAVRREKAKLDRLTGAQASRRGRRGMEGKDRSATTAEKRKIEKQRALVKAARQERRAVEAKWKQARRDRVKSNPKKYATGLVDEDGNRISTQQILEHMRADEHHGGGAGKVDLPAFVSHRRDRTGKNAYFVNWSSGRKSAATKGTRTGEATRTGGHAAGFRALEEHLVSTQGVVDAIREWDRFAKQFIVKKPGGKLGTWDEMEKLAQDVEEATGVPMTPVRAVPARFDEATRAEIAARQASGSLPDDLHKITIRRMELATQRPTGKQTANVGLVPTSQIKRFAEHQTKGSGTASRAGQAATGLFTRTVLPFSTKWMTGNIVESALRSLLYGITPRDVFNGRKLMRAIEVQSVDAYKAMDSRTRGGLLFGGADKLAVRRASEDFENTALFRPAQALEATAQVPVIRQIYGGLQGVGRMSFSLNRAVAKAFETGVIGKEARREIQEMTGSWTKAMRFQAEAVNDLAKGYTGTAKQIRAARAVDEILGKYTRFSPGTRRIVQAYAPFLPWYLNAARFCLYTLPVKHPLKAALLANVEQTFSKEIEEQAQYALGETTSSLDSGIRMPDGGILDLSRYTPFGAFTTGTEALADPWLPQISTFVKILGSGQAWTGKELRLQSGERVTDSKKLWLAFYAALESTLPGVALARRAQEHGETAWDDSTVFRPKTKEGTSYGSSAGGRIFNPFRPTYLNAPTGKEKPTSALPATRAKGGSLLERRAQALGRQSELESAGESLLERRRKALTNP